MLAVATRGTVWQRLAHDAAVRERDEDFARV
jgi:hypothetical protein